MKNQNTNYTTLYGNDITKESGDRYLNEFRSKWHTNPEKEIVEDFPLFLDIEASSACNLKCPTCIQTIDPNFKKGFMDFGMFEKIIDEASDNGCYGCKFHTLGRGEPLLNKELPKMIAYAKKKGLIDVYLNTNGVLLNWDLSERLMDAGLDRISFSIDSHIPEVFEKIRPGVKFIEVCKNVVDFKMIRDHKYYKTKIRIQTIDLSELDKEEYIDYWYSECDEIGLIRYKDMSVRKNFTSDWKCPQLWQRMSITYDGSIILCNHDDRNFAVLGNIRNDSIRKIWNSRAMGYARNLHSKGKAHLLSACNGCFLRTSESEGV